MFIVESLAEFFVAVSTQTPLSELLALDISICHIDGKGDLIGYGTLVSERLGVKIKYSRYIIGSRTE